MKNDLSLYYNNLNNKVILTNDVSKYINVIDSNVITITQNNFKKSLIKNTDSTKDIYLLLDFRLLSSYKMLDKLVTNIINLSKYLYRNNLQFKYLIVDLNNAKLENLNEIENDLLFHLIHSVIAISFSSKKERYEYLYDIVCDYLDKQFIDNNLCDFKDGKCIANRNNFTVHPDNGCCYDVKYLGHLTFQTCGYCKKLSENGCTIKCISCKFFTCKYYRKKGISFEPKNIFLINKFFNDSQKLVLKYNIYRTKEEIIDKLVNNKLLPYFLSLLTKDYYIKEG